MNPWGLMFIALGFLMIVVGFKGSQHNVMKAFKGTTKSDGGSSKQNPPTAKPPNLM